MWRNYVAREDRFNRYAEMTSHGPWHLEGVATFVSTLASMKGFLTDSEAFVLLAAAYLHDVGMYETGDRFYSRPMQMRAIHGALSMGRVRRERHLLLPTLHDDEVELIATLCSYHQKWAALSKEDWETFFFEDGKWMRLPPQDEENGSDDIDPSKLAPQRSLQQRLVDLTHEGRRPFALKGVGDKGICPFLLATLLKLLDGADFQVSRAGSLEALLRHADRNISHARRSGMIMEHTRGSGSPTYMRATTEKRFFEGSQFHFLRNLLIEQSLLIPDGKDRVEFVLKPADPDDLLYSCRRIVVPMEKNGKTPHRRYGVHMDTLERYLDNPVGTIRANLKRLGWKDKDIEGFLGEWRGLERPGEGKRSFHFLVGRKYIEKELQAVADALVSPTTDTEYHYCSVCPNQKDCDLKHRRIPSFQDDNGEWNVKEYEAHVHAPKLVHVPHLAPTRNRLERVNQRDQSVDDVVHAIRKDKQLLLYGPSGRGKEKLARLAIRKLTNNEGQRILWHTVKRGEGQVARFIKDLAQFLACNGNFALQNLIRGEAITPLHEDYALRALSLAQLHTRDNNVVFCIDEFNNLEVTSRSFFLKAIECAICGNCSDPSQCSKQESKRWGCDLAGIYVLVMSTKVPGRSWLETAGEFPIRCCAAPPLSDAELQEAVEAATREDPAIAAKIKDIWTDYGKEPVGIGMLEDRVGTGWDGERRVEWFAKDMEEFLVRTFDETTLGAKVNLEALKLMGLLNGHLTAGEVVRIFHLQSARDEGALQKLMDRGLVQEVDGKLFAHAACDTGHRRSRWMDRVGHHPRCLLLRYVALGDDPAGCLQSRWATIAPYLPELQSLRNLAGGPHHAHNPLQHSFLTLATLDQLVKQLDEIFLARSPKIRSDLAQVLFSQNNCPDLTRSASLRLAALLHDCGKRRAFQEEEGRVSFHGHEKYGAEQWRALAKACGIAREVVEHCGAIIERHMHPANLFLNEQVTDRALKNLVKQSGEWLPELLLLFLADLLASGKMDDRRSEAEQFMRQVLERAEQSWQQADEKNANRLTGEHLIRAGLHPGPNFGKALDAANKAGRDDPDLGEDELIEIAKQVYNE
jgi:putative nucleotidyltransferase with HDIG domain